MHSMKKASSALPEGMTDLEQNCLEMTATGYDRIAIGLELKLSAREVELLLYCAQRKLGATNLMHAVARYLTSEMAGTDRR